MATNSSPKSKITLEHMSRLVQAVGFNPSLPSAAFAPSGDLLFANDRMLDLLGIVTKNFPVPSREVSALWPFANDQAAGPKIFESFIADRSSGDSVIVFFGLKTYKLSQQSDAASGVTLVVAELLRSGDLLSDRDSRQNLFRTLSHEIRTAVATFKGYTAMIETTSEAQAQILARMKTSLERLENVVHRLDDFKVELNLSDPKKKG